MKTRLFICLVASLVLFIAVAPRSWAQAPAAGSSAGGYTAWFELRNNVLLVHTGAQSKPIGKNVTLLNGTRLDYKARTAVLADGRTVALHEGDQISLSGTITQAGGATASAEPAVASKPEPKPEPAPAPAPITAPVKPQPAAFGYQPVLPKGGKLKGVVELGASGFNSFIVRIDGQKNWKLERSEFGNSLVMENLATEDDVRVGLKNYIGKMLDYGVGGRDIHFVVSSGAATADVTKRIVRGLKELGYVVTTVTAEQEGVFALQSVLPASYAGRAFVVDLGSGNTKISWLQGTRPVSTDTYGAKYFQQGTDDATVDAQVRRQVDKVPAAQRATCFIIGGFPHELAKAGRQDQERYTVLRPPADYPQLSGAKSKSGLNIYRAVAEATGCQQFVFDWDANFTIGYLLSLP